MSIGPILFCLFLENLDEYLIRRKEGGTVVGREKIFALKFADDVALVAESVKELQQMINTTQGYAKKNNLTIQD